MDNNYFLNEAILEAKKGLKEGGVPIGSILVHKGKIVGRGHNRSVQKESCILHAEMDALENTGRRSADFYKDCEIYTTLSPCSMCSGAILLYGITSVIIGENTTFLGEENLLKSRGVNIEVLDNQECVRLMEDYIIGKI